MIASKKQFLTLSNYQAFNKNSIYLFFLFLGKSPTKLTFTLPA
ncbi:hypothetical protein M23134_03859 [Microscilla marina ATCC 23134]|uniref:Uncharacterized protein n=1 Tax=Microscilla marina ATCC 23134 TaxID=313606 RepID=A1ZMC7_MICM2|nr:hypothetical protein M23134_03859 [Microscilla marina ATCC 23134]